MRELRESEREYFPAYGARARQWARFERDLEDWLATPEGRFAAWRAQAALTADAPDED